MHLKNIEKIFRLIPTTFLLISSIVAIAITYLLLELQEQREIDLLKQKKILENQFNKKELLHAFNTNVQNKIDTELVNIHQYLREHTFKVIGGLKHHLNSHSEKTTVECLSDYEKENNVHVAVFEETELDLIYGKDRIVFLAALVFGSSNKNYQEIILQYITSQGRYNLQEWRNDLAGTLKLSFFDRFSHKGKSYYVGTFSKLVDIRAITKNMIKQEIDLSQEEKSYYIWFYDMISGNTYNFHNDKRELKINQIVHLVGDKIQKEFLSENNGDQIKQFANHSVSHDRKNKLSIAINAINGLNIDEHKIEVKYDYLFLKYSALIAFISLLLLITSRHLSLFIKVQLDAQELKQQVEVEVEKNRQKDRMLIQQSKLAGMGEMLGNIAHQWRQPLNNVSLFLQFIQSNYQDNKGNAETIQKYFNKAFIQIDYMSQTIDDFRNFYKPSKQKSNFLIKEAVDSAIDIIGVQLKDANIELVMDIDDIMVYSFENELKQSFLNILSNAHQAILEKKQHSAFRPYIKIVIEEVNSQVEIKISNNGGEIDEEVLPRVFEPYFTTKFESKGTGLGLYMTKSIIEVNLKGTIEAENFFGGVSFNITLPQERKE